MRWIRFSGCVPPPSTVPAAIGRVVLSAFLLSLSLVATAQPLAPGHPGLMRGLEPDAAARLEPEERERLRSELREHRQKHRESERARWRDASPGHAMPPMMPPPGAGFVPEEGALRAAVRGGQDPRMLSSEERAQLRLQLRERRTATP